MKLGLLQVFNASAAVACGITAGVAAYAQNTDVAVIGALFAAANVICVGISFNGKIPVKLHPANDDEADALPAKKPGDRMHDGTVFAGTLPETGKAVFATPADAPLAYSFKQAQKYAAKLDAHGHKDWRVPTKSELNMLYNNRAAIGGFTVTANPATWYWSSSLSRCNGAWGQRFSGVPSQDFTGKGLAASLRCVR